MSATNHTTNYNLPQFVGTDKPTWLTDVNGALSTIDTQMKANADSATGADTKATTANNSIGTLSNLSTTAKTDLVSAINEVNTATGVAQTTANTAISNASDAQTTANSAENGVNAVNDYLNLTSFVTYNNTGNFTRTVGVGTMTGVAITVARNADGTLCKIYGSVGVSNANNTALRFKLNLDTGLRPSENIVISNTGLCTSENIFSDANLQLNTDGTIELFCNAPTSGFAMRYFACLIFVKNFGDTGNN